MLSKLYRCHVNRLSVGDDILVECSGADGHSVLYEAKVQELFIHLGIFLVLLNYVNCKFACIGLIGQQ